MSRPSIAALVTELIVEADRQDCKARELPLVPDIALCDDIREIWTDVGNEMAWADHDVDWLRRKGTEALILGIRFVLRCAAVSNDG